MPKISVRIDPELKKEMEKSSHLNWSEIIRQAIRKQINHESEKNVAQAVLLNEKVRKKASETTTDTVEIIRKFREVRK
ncbi:MAG: hypothetical protein GF308_02515 [Candidatus Heimdallarchaeota archaeon]|nr:hypothetical protein [Candidatus Heimdallarchaeota archaeon]